MKTTMTFTTEHEAELNRIAGLGKFASKIAHTMLSKEVYTASAKQVDILNEVSEMGFFVSNDYANQYEVNAYNRQQELKKHI